MAVVDPLIFLAALVVTAWNLIATVARRSTEDIYLSNWYTIGGVLWTCIIALVAILPWYQYGLGQVSVSGFYMHNAVGMWFTPLALGIFYYACRSYSTGRSIPTRSASSPSGPISCSTRSSARIISIQPAAMVSADHRHRVQCGDAGTGVGRQRQFLLTMRGRMQGMAQSYPLMFIFVGVIGYLVGSTQGTFEAFRSLQEVWHLTNFTVGHSHLTMYGFVTFAIWGGVYALLPLATGKQPSRLGLALHFWMALVGCFIYVISLSVGGTIQGLDWIHGLPFIQSVADMQSYWVWRGVGGSLMLLSHIVFAWNVWRMSYGPWRDGIAGSTPLRTRGGRRMNKLILIAGARRWSIACLACADGRAARHRAVEHSARPRSRAADGAEAQGRDVYVANGCSYCHTQQVRPLDQDKVFGRPSAPGDFTYQTPELLGSERTGPDLTNIGERQPSEVWQYIHLYNPRAVVPQSIMPAFDWMFQVVDQAPPG